MVNVAVAGGTGALGRAIVEALQDSPHKAFVLSRKAPSKVTPVDNATAVQIDYTSVAGMTAALEAHGIHTVISALSLNDASDGAAQLHLIRAANAATSVKRFVASDYGTTELHPDWHHVQMIKNRVEPLGLLKTTSLEWTRFSIGMFLDYFGMPHIKTYLQPFIWPIVIEHAVAALPGDGEGCITFTYSFDVARFVVAALDLPKWEEEMRVVGDTVTLNMFVRMAEEVRGRKFDVKYDSVDGLQRGEVTDLPGMEALYAYFPNGEFKEAIAMFAQWTVLGLMTVERAGALNDRFPEIEPLTVREMLEQCWREK